MKVSEEIKLYEQEMFELMCKQSTRTDIDEIFMVDGKLDWLLIDDQDADIEDTEDEELITTLVSFAYPERTERFYKGFIEGEIQRTVLNQVFFEIVEALHISEDKLESDIKESYRNFKVVRDRMRQFGLETESFKEFRESVLFRQNSIKTKVKAAAELNLIELFKLLPTGKVAH